MRHSFRLLTAALIALSAGWLSPVPGALATQTNPPTQVGAPTLIPADGSYQRGLVTVASEPTVAGDSVAELSVDGEPLTATATSGNSRLSFEVGSNSTEAKYGNHVLVNGTHRLDIGDAVNQRVTLNLPNDWLVKGENKVQINAGAVPTACGLNYDDFVLTDVRLSLLGGDANGEDNQWSYSFGDGSCGSNATLLKQATLSFFVLDDPASTTGLTAQWDTSTVANGPHDVTTVTDAGMSVTHIVQVNNAPAGAPAVTPEDGTIARGLQPVFASQPVGSSATTTALTIDGAPLNARPTLGSGDAVLAFNVGTNSIEGRYKNYLLVNGMRVEIGGDWVSQQVKLTVPNQYLVPGANTVRVVTGSFPGTCGDNRDDFTISKIALTPASGTAAPRDLKASYAMGDGNCGSSATLLREVDLNFTVDAPAQGLRADLDTATVTDGAHTLSATSGAGQSASRTIFVDNTAPVVVYSSPEAGEHITSSLPLDLEVDDATGVIGQPAIALDGAPIKVGDPVGPGLKSGSHTLAVSVKDSLGNSATREIVFTSAGIPAVPSNLSPKSGTTDVGRSTTVSATVSEPDGGPVTATFAEASINGPMRAWQGEVAEMPTTLAIEGERRFKHQALEPGKPGAVTSPASADIAYQRYDVRADDEISAPVLRWEGTVDPTRLVTLHAWNVTTQQWDALDASRGSVEGPTLLIDSAVSEDYLDGRRIHALVTAEDPFADDLDASNSQGFDDPASYDFSMVHFTDTQYLAEGAVENPTPEERAVWEKAYGDVTRWIADNQEARKIAYAVHTGDIIENNIRKPATPEMAEQIIGEFEVSSKLQKTLDDANVPNQVLAGNHDNQSGTENGPEALYNKYFSTQRYEGAAQSWANASYGGGWREGDNQNNYGLFTAGGLDFVVVGLSYGVTREEAEWASSIFARYPDRNGVLLSHDYLRPSSSPDGRGGTFSAPDGSLLYNKIVATNPNVFLVLAGHEHGVATNVKPEVGVVGNGVVELLADYQFYEVPAGQLGLDKIAGYPSTKGLRFGASYFRMLQFDVDRSELSVDTYSPFLNNFGATEYDTNKRYDGREDTMRLPIDLSTRTTSFTTESVGVFEPIDIIGETTVPSGATASVRWSGLTPNSAYAWMVIATSKTDGVTSSMPVVFATRTRGGRPSRALDGMDVGLREGADERLDAGGSGHAAWSAGPGLPRGRR